jgi:hypothetical protein
MKALLPFALATVLFCGCKPPAPAPQGETPPAAARDVGSNTDGALDDAAFVFVAAPVSGERVSPGFAVRGASRTFESTVNWRLLAADGSELATGHTTGGGVDGHGPFSFVVTYQVTERQIGHLEVFEVDASDGEGRPPGRNVIPLVLQP